MSVVDEEPELPEYPGRSPAFRRLMRKWGMSDQGKQNVHLMESQASDVMEVTDEELVILTSLHIRDIATEAEVARRNIAALVAFKQESATASSRLVRHTRWLIGFTVAIVVLTIGVAVLTGVVAILTGVVAWHDLTR